MNVDCKIKQVENNFDHIHEDFIKERKLQIVEKKLLQEEEKLLHVKRIPLSEMKKYSSEFNKEFKDSSKIITITKDLRNIGKLHMLL